MHPILVVDDDPTMRRMMRDLLRERGIEASCSESVEEALDALRHGSFALVVSDVDMPAMNGFELLREMRKRKCGAPVVLMTSFGGSDTEQRATRAGAFGYLEKPFQPEDLYEMVERALGG